MNVAIDECPYCKGLGQILSKDAEGRVTARNCECTIRMINENRMRKAGVTKLFVDRRFENYNDYGDSQLLDAKKTAMEYAKNFKNISGTENNSILLSGQAGAGKTHLGVAICSLLIEQNVDVVYMSYLDSMKTMKQNSMDESFWTEINQYKDAGVLYIDDFLKGSYTDADVKIVMQLINHRYINGLPMIVSTERTLAELIDFDEASCSRLLQMCDGHVVTFKGKYLNYRLFKGNIPNLKVVV